MSFANYVPPFSNYVIKCILPDGGTRCNLEKDHATKDCKVMGIFVPKYSETHGKG